MKRPAGTSSDIESVLREQRSFVPPREFAARARLKERELSALHRRAQACIAIIASGTMGI